MRLSDALAAHRPLIADGSNGWLIASKFQTVEPDPKRKRLLPLMVAPDIVRDTHLAYINAGARLIFTHTFEANASHIARFGWEKEVAEFNINATRLAREAVRSAGCDAAIGGSIGPLDEDFLRTHREDAATHVFAEQIEALLTGGVDTIVLETFTSLPALTLAIRAVRQVSSDIPIVATTSYTDPPDALASSESPQEVAQKLEEAGVAAIGVNCVLGPIASLEVLRRMASVTRLPLVIKPNAGAAHERTGYHHPGRKTIEVFVGEAVRCGAAIIGGCCGLGPDDIHAMASAVSELAPEALRETAIEPIYEVQTQPEDGVLPPSRFSQKLRAGTFVISVQLDPPEGRSAEALRKLIEQIRSNPRVDVVDINSSGKRLAHDSIAVAARLQEWGVETMPHITPRESAVFGIQSHVLAAYALFGIRNFLIVRGDPLRPGTYVNQSGVYETDSIGLTRAVADLRESKGNAARTGGPVPLALGVALNQNEEDLAHEFDRLRAKIDAGANFAMTQPFFDLDDWRRFRERLDAEGFRLPVIPGIWPLLSGQQGRKIRENVDGVVVPDSVIRRLEAAGADAATVGFDIARGILEGAPSEGAAGAYLVAPFKQPSRVLTLLE